MDWNEKSECDNTQLIMRRTLKKLFTSATTSAYRELGHSISITQIQCVAGLCL